MPSRRARIDQIEQRRVEVAQMVAEGATQREMSEALGVSVGTINNDIRILRGRWSRSQIEDIDGVMIEDLHRIDRTLAAVMPKALSGELYAIDRVVNLIQLRANLLGYEPPKKLDITSGGEALKFATETVVNLTLSEKEAEALEGEEAAGAAKE